MNTSIPPSNDATFYHYKLIRKITLRAETKFGYLFTALMGMAALYLAYSLSGLAAGLMSLFIMLAIHGIVLRLTIRRVSVPSVKRFAFRRDWPWIGFLPVTDTNLSLFRRLHYHLLLVGCCVSLLAYPWTGSSWIVALFFWHLWLLAPRLRLLWRMRRDKGDGVIRLGPLEVHYYHR